MQSLRVSSYRTQKRINIQNDSVLLYTNRFYVLQKRYRSQTKRKRREVTSHLGEGQTMDTGTETRNGMKELSRKCVTRHGGEYSQLLN